MTVASGMPGEQILLAKISLLHTADPELAAPRGAHVRKKSQRCFRTFRVLIRGSELTGHINEALVFGWLKLL